MNETGYVVIFVTSTSEGEAAKIARMLVEEKLAACCNIVPQIRSIFSWKGEVCDEQETLLIVKSRGSMFERIKERVIQLHSYDVPEIIALPIRFGLQDYLEWIDKVTRNKTQS